MVEFRTRPYVRIKGMTNWEIVEQEIRKGRIKAGKVLEQHFTTSCKLQAAKNHEDRLCKMIPTKRITDLPIRINVEQQKVAPKFLPSFRIKAEEYLEELDGFFYSLRGCLDSFLWEINLILELGFCRISYSIVKSKMKEKHNKKETTKSLEKLKHEQWFTYLGDIRNELTHHTLSELVTFPPEDLKIYLPSVPRRNRYSREERYEVLTCLKTLRNNTLEFLEKGYNAILVDLHLLE